MRDGVIIRYTDNPEILINLGPNPKTTRKTKLKKKENGKCINHAIFLQYGYIYIFIIYIYIRSLDARKVSLLVIPREFSML